MADNEKQTLGKVELEFLQKVAERQPISVRALVELQSNDSGQARTTVLTVLERLRRKGYLTRRKIQGVNHYSTRVSVSDLLQRLVSDFVQKMLGGSVSPFVSYLHEQNHLDPEELAQLRSLVDEFEKRQKDSPLDPEERR